MSHAYFNWSSKGLIAANTGKPFSIGGLEAVCNSHRSDETERNPGPFDSALEAKRKVDALRANRLDAYKRCPGDVIEHARAEKEMGLDYTNRLLLELLQNADDAAATDPIGYKGLGFKAVLDVGERVRIRSGNLRVRFSREDSQKALRAADLPSADEVPVLRLPFWDDQDLAIPEVEAVYATIITLESAAPIIRNGLFAKEWEAVTGDPTILLFLHAIDEVYWQPPEGDRILWRCERDGDVRNLSAEIGDKVTHKSRWRIFRDPSGQTASAAAVLVDSDGYPTPYRHDKIRVFFPTEEICPVPMYLHGEFDLEQNRKRVRPGANRPEIVQSLACCVKSVLTSVHEDGIFLDLLAPLDGMTGLADEVWRAIKATLLEMVLPQCGVRLCDVRLCPDAGTKDFPWNSINRVPNWQKFKELLTHHRPGGLAGTFFLTPGVDNEKREKVVMALNSTAKLSIEELRNFPLLPIEGDASPQATFNCYLFFPPKDSRLTPAPEGIQVGFISRAFAVDCELNPEVKRLLQALGVQEFKPQSIAQVLAKQQLAAVVPEKLWAYLLSNIAPLLKESDGVIDWKSKDRNALAEQVNVPCHNGEWKPAKDVYAGQEWTGNDFLERAYTSNRNRSFFLPPEEDETRRKQIELIARWLGVGWSPKVLCVVNESEPKQRILWQCGRFPFPLPNAPRLWNDHCITLNKDNENDVRCARLREDWQLDGDASVLELSGAFTSIGGEWAYYETYRQASISRSSSKRCDHDNVCLPDSPSYLWHLFQHVAWIPVDGSEKLAPPRDLFSQASEVYQTLSDWVFAPARHIPTHVQERLGIRSSWNSVTPSDWNHWLLAATKVDGNENESDRSRTKRLYAEALRRCSSNYPGKIWCVEKRPDNTDAWHLVSSGQNVWFVDRPDLSRLRLKGIRTFPVELGRRENKDKACEIFGIQSLSKALQGSASFRKGEPQPDLADEIRWRLRERSPCLEAYLRARDHDPTRVSEKWRTVSFRVGLSLQVKFLLHQHELETQSCPAFFQESALTPPSLWLDSDENFTAQGKPKDILWEEVGLALCHAAGRSDQLDDGAVFADLLGCDEASLKRKLLNRGVTEVEIANALPKTPVLTPRVLTLTPPRPVTPVPTLPLAPLPIAVSPTQSSTSTLVPLGTTQPGGGHRLPASGSGRGGGHGGGGGGGGENRAHRDLKDKLWKHPEIIEAGMHQFRYEPSLESHFRPDLILIDVHERFVAIEVESEFPGESDYGVWQTVAYKHVTAAEFNQACGNVRGILVAPSIPNGLKQKCKELGVEWVEVGDC